MVVISYYFMDLLKIACDEQRETQCFVFSVVFTYMPILFYVTSFLLLVMKSKRIGLTIIEFIENRPIDFFEIIFLGPLVIMMTTVPYFFYKLL